MKTRLIHLLALLLPLLACAGTTWQTRIVNQAAFDHRCSADQIQILRASDDTVSRSVDLSVCGKERRYRDIGGSKAFVWLDVTNGFPAGAAVPATP